MDFALPAAARDWQERAKTFAEEELIPWEVEAEMNDGCLPVEIDRRHRQHALEMGLSRMDVPKKHGGLELGTLAQTVVWEQLGRVTNALCWCFSEPQAWMFEACSPWQIETFVLPLADGSRHECYAITEAESGSELDVSTTATRVDGGYRIDGEKWFVTSANLADFAFVQARTPEGEDAMFFVDMSSDGLSMIDNPRFSHTFAAHHPTYRFDGLVVPSSHRIGEEGDGMRYALGWFRRERLMIAARCCGAAARLIEESVDFAGNRKVAGESLAERQAIQFMLADSTTELWAARLMLYEAAAAHDRGDDIKSLHSRCSMVKLYASEMANRVADRAVQIFGGRGYMRETAAERFFRELRVDRIWEGTSEIQRLIIARGLLRRGLPEL